MNFLRSQQVPSQGSVLSGVFKELRRRHTLPMIGLLCWGLAASLPTAHAQGDPGECLSTEEQTLFELLNAYRAENGKAAIPVSASLSKVAQYHVWDLQTNDPVGGVCNLHSWSDQYPPEVVWTEVCYTADHAEAQKMWDKPREITENLYTGNGYEVAVASSGGMTAEAALDLWKNSPPHNDVLLNLGIWANFDPWPGVGMGILGDYAVMWFGDQADPAGPIEECDTNSDVGSVGADEEAWLWVAETNPVSRVADSVGFLLTNPTAASLDISVFDVEGRFVRSVHSGFLDSGVQTIHWDLRDEAGRRVQRGVYFARVGTNGATKSAKIVVTP